MVKLFVCVFEAKGADRESTPDDSETIVGSLQAVGVISFSLHVNGGY